MKAVNKHIGSHGARLALGLAACLFGSGVAHAEVQLAEKDGWTFTFDGRVNSFLSGGFGQDLPLPAGGGTHTVMGTNSAATNGIPDSGWPANYGQSDPNNKFVNVRVRSGMYGNILGFGIARQLTPTTTVKGYISIWSTVESLGEDKWAPITAEAREGHLTAIGPWGSLKAGRMLGWVGRSSYEIDAAYGHGYGVGLPCTDALGPACGHIGTGALFPGYSAGISYSTPSAGGLQLHVGAYDPITFGAGSWDHAGFLRPEGAITFDRKLGETARLTFAVEGLYQTLSRLTMDMAGAETKLTSAVWGASGGVRLEAGPVRLGLSAFSGKGLGLFYALQKTQVTEDAIHDLRTTTGFYGQGGVVFGRLHLTGGFGLSQVTQTANDKVNAMLSVIRYQRGISAAAYFHATDSIVIGLDYFNFAAGWWGAPLVDASTTPPVVTGKQPGEKQLVNFVSAGVTYHW